MVGACPSWKYGPQIGLSAGQKRDLTAFLSAL